MFGNTGNELARSRRFASQQTNLAIRLAEAGRRAEGLTPPRKPVDLRRELVESNRDAYLPDLANRDAYLPDLAT